MLVLLLLLDVLINIEEETVVDSLVDAVLVDVVAVVAVVDVAIVLVAVVITCSHNAPPNPEAHRQTTSPCPDPEESPLADPDSSSSFTHEPPFRHGHANIVLDVVTLVVAGVVDIVVEGSLVDVNVVLLLDDEMLLLLLVVVPTVLPTVLLELTRSSQ